MVEATIFLFFTGLSVALVVRGISVFRTRSIFRQGFFGDSSVHWMLLQTVKAHPRFKTIPQYVIGEEPSSYPRAFHLYAALFPLDSVKLFPWLPNLVLYSLFSGLFTGYSYYVFGLAGYQPFYGAILGLLFFVFAVSNLTFDGASIAYLKLSERLLARLAGSLYFLAMAVAVDYSDMFSFTLACITGAVAANSSKFGRQAILFCTPLVAFLTLSLTPLFIFLLSFAGALIIGQKHFIHSVKSQIQHLIVYHSDIRKSASHKQSLSRFVDWRLLLNTKTGFKTWVRNLILFEPSRSMLRYPDLLFLLLGVLIYGEFFSASFAIIIASLFVYIITTTRYFSFLGESYRYIEYNLSFLLPLALAQLFMEHPQFSFLIPALILFSVFISLSIHLIFRQPDFPDSDRLTAFLEKLNLAETDVVFPVSMRLGADICARAPCKSFWWQPGNVTKDIMSRFVEHYPYLKKDWKTLAKDFNVTHIIIDKNAALVPEWSYDFSDLTILHEDDIYRAYKVGH